MAHYLYRGATFPTGKTRTRALAKLVARSVKGRDGWYTIFGEDGFRFRLTDEAEAAIKEIA